MFVRLDGSLHSHDTHSVKCHYMRTMLILFLGHHFHLNCDYSKFYRLFVTPSAPGAVKSAHCAFFFELLELI